MVNTRHEYSIFSQFDELDVETLDFLQEFILSENLFEGEGILIQDVVDGAFTSRNRTNRRFGRGVGGRGS